MPNVLVINHYAANKGDRAVLQFVARELLRAKCGQITLSVHERALWEGEHRSHWGGDVRLVPWGWNTEMSAQNGRFGYRLWWERQRFFKRIAYPLVRKALNSGRQQWPLLTANRQFLTALKTADLVISTGGHHVTTLLAAEGISEPFFDMALTLLARKPLVLWSQSIGPFEFKDLRNRTFTQRILQGCREILVRDAHSFEELKPFEVPSDRFRQTHESVLGMNDVIAEYVPPSQREPVVGIAIYAAQARKPEDHRAYVDTIAALVDHAVRKGYRIRFFPMELKGSGPDDRRLIREIIGEAKNGSEDQILDQDVDTFRHLEEVSKCRIFVGHKTHSAIFALTVGTPLVALAYHRKTEDFMAQYGLKENAIPDAKLNIDHLIEVFNRVDRDADAIGEKQFQISRQLGESVRTDFHNMLYRYFPSAENYA